MPLAISWPDRIKEASSSDLVALMMDLFPTLCQVADAEVDHQIEGKSFLATLLGEEQNPFDRPHVWVRREGGRRYGGRSYYAIRKGSFKLLQNTPFEEMQLYDLSEDPHEARPLPRDSEAYLELFRLLRQHIGESGLVPWQRSR